MLNDSALSFHSLPWAHEDHYGNGNGDLAEIFDDREDFQEIFSSDSFVPGGQTNANHHGVVRSNHTVEGVFQQSGPMHASQLPQQQSSAVNTQPRPLVNLQMIVDPTTGKVTYPRQILTYDVGGGKVENVIFGPVTLDANPQEVRQMETPMASAATELSHQPFFMPVSPSPTPSANDGSSSSNSSGALGIPLVPVGIDVESPPVRALSAYNFFFRDERERILHGGEYEWTSDKQARLLAAHWQQDRSKKRRHRKTHGKINFTTLSKLVSQRWKDLEEDQKQFYRQVAAQDFERYQREMDEYKKRLGKPLTFQHVVG